MQTESYEVLVHAGAHCCGAEGFQRFLGANRNALSAAGYDLAYPGRFGADGGNFDCAFPEPKHQGAALDEFAAAIGSSLTACRQGGRGLIVSEQDLAGRMANLLGGRFYPAAFKRAEALRNALDRPIDRLVIAIRPYDEIFLAVWQRFALDRHIEPFEEYAPAMANFSGGWVDVVEALRDGLEARRVSILAMKPQAPEILAHLVPAVRLADPVLPADTPAITDSAIAMIQRHFAQGARFAPGQRERLLAFHARQPQLASVNGFAGLQLADLRGRYVADLDALARTADVELIGGMLPAVAAE